MVWALYIDGNLQMKNGTSSSTLVLLVYHRIPRRQQLPPGDPQLPYACNVHLFASSMAVLSYILSKLHQSCLYTNADRILNSNTPNSFTSQPPSMKH
jgi:hypothetical protein